MQRLLARIGRWPGLRWVEGWVRSLPPWAAVALFALPTALLLPIKLLALWAIGRGHVVLGMLVYFLYSAHGAFVTGRVVGCKLHRGSCKSFDQIWCKGRTIGRLQNRRRIGIEITFDDNRFATGSLKDQIIAIARHFRIGYEFGRGKFYTVLTVRLKRHRFLRISCSGRTGFCPCACHVFPNPQKNKLLPNQNSRGI